MTTKRLATATVAALGLFVLAATATAALQPSPVIPEAHAHGLGLDTISSIDVQGKEISISVEMPLDLGDAASDGAGGTGEDDASGGGGVDGRITITATEDESGEPARNVTFLIGMFHDDTMVFRNYFFAEGGVLPIAFSSLPEVPGNFSIGGERDSLLGAYHGTPESPVRVSGPVFAEGGLYTFEIEVRTIDEPTNIVEDAGGVHTADLSVASTAFHEQTDSNGTAVTFKTKSYFDRISDFDYDHASRTVTFEMPFDWSEGRMSHIPVVHEEVSFPKDLAEFFSPSYTGYANGIELFRASVNVDDYSDEDRRVVHFVLLQDHLRFLKNEMKRSGEPLPDRIVFTLSASQEVSFPLTAYTQGEDLRVDLSWDPPAIEPGVDTNFVFTIRDGATGEPLRNSDYTFVILQNGREIHRASGTAQVGGEFEKFAFGEDQTGPTTIRFEDIRGSGQDTEFGIVVAPEFGGIAMSVLAAVAMAAALLAARGRTRPLTPY